MQDSQKQHLQCTTFHPMRPTTTPKIPSRFLTQQNIITIAKEKLSKTHSPKMLNITFKNFSVVHGFLTTLIWRFDYHYSNSCALKDVYSHRHKTKFLALSRNYFKMWQTVTWSSYTRATAIPENQSWQDPSVHAHSALLKHKMVANLFFLKGYSKLFYFRQALM